jgi:hypothetical protein
MDQVVQIIGALLVLTGFASAQFGWLTPNSRTYLLVNLAGAGILAYVAAADAQYGFLLLEGVWALVSMWGLLRRGADTAPAG